MKDKRIWQFKRRAEEDNFITAGACRLILRIASWRYCTRHHPADSEFALSWREMAAWYDFEGPEAILRRETIYDWLQELVLHRYLFYNGRKGCPATSCYRLDLNHKSEYLALFDWAAEHGRDVFKPVSDAGKIRQLDAGKIRQPDAGKNRAPIYSYSLREEMYKPKGKKLSGAPARRQETKGGSNGSLRSKETRSLTLSNGNGASTVPTSKQLPAEDKATQECDPSAAAETGVANPPGRGRKAPPSLEMTPDEIRRRFQEAIKSGGL